MKKLFSVLLSLGLFLTSVACSNNPKSEDPSQGEDMAKHEITTIQPKIYDDGIYTVSQSSGDYSARLALPSDNMMVFANGYDKVEGQIRGWIRDSDYKQIDVFIPIGRDFNSYYVKGSYDGSEHYDIIQTSADGTRLRHPTGDTFYVLPSEGFVDFLIDYAALALKAGAKDVYLEEPDGFTQYLYCEYFKSKWTDVYGAWADPADDVNIRYRADRLLADIFTQAMNKFSVGIKERYPDTKVYLCTHSSLSYQSHPISANNFAIVNLPEVDGIIAQAWTDTSFGLQVETENGMEVKPFEVSYSEYSELYSIARETGKKYYSLSDPAADQIASLGFDAARKIYEQNVTAQLIQPEINAFQISIWPDRSFGNANEDYKRVQQEVFACMQEVGTLPAVRRSGSVGTGILTSYNCASNGNWMQVNNYIQSINIPLLEEGVPPDILLLESLGENTLQNYRVIFVSYDYIKPEEVKTNEILADFVKNGGTLIVLDGGGANRDYNGFWGEGNSAVKSLMSEMDIEYFSDYSVGALNAITTSNAPEYFKTLALPECSFANVKLGGGTDYLKNKDKSVLSGVSYGDGNILVLGVDSNALIKNGAGKEFVKSLVRFAFTLSGEEYVATKYLITERGDYIAIKTYETSIELKGTFVNLFDNEMKVVKNPIVGQNSYGVFKKLKDDGIPRVFAANCADVVSEEVNDILTFETKTIFMSETAVLVSLPNVSYSQITVQDSVTEENLNFTANYDGTAKILRLSYIQSVKNTVKVSIVLDYSA